DRRDGCSREPEHRGVPEGPSHPKYDAREENTMLSKQTRESVATPSELFEKGAERQGQRVGPRYRTETGDEGGLGPPHVVAGEQRGQRGHGRGGKSTATYRNIGTRQRSRDL